MTEMVQPKICATCRQVCDRLDGTWIHTQELVGRKTHECVPVDYDETLPLIARCDFCYAQVPLAERWIQPAKDFIVPIVNHGSRGGWCCCLDCLPMVRERDWQAVLDRHYSAGHNSTRDDPLVRQFMLDLFLLLDKNITEPVRPFRAGDELVPA